MVSRAIQHNIGSYLKAVASLAPVAGTGSAQNGASVDRYGPNGAGATALSALAVLVYTTSGGVTGGTIVATVQDSADNSNFTAYTQDNGVAAAISVTIAAGPNATGIATANVDLAHARRYIRISVDSDPTGGTPASIVTAFFVLGGDDTLPAA